LAWRVPVSSGDLKWAGFVDNCPAGTQGPTRE
jgi:hypothetical protein